jgi:transcriptional regulator with XRE-family HTH domain
MTIPFKKFKDEWMKDAEFRAEYERLKPEFTLAIALIKAREKAGMTQDQVARRMGTTQSVVARIESGQNPPNLRTLERYAQAVGRRIQVKLVNAGAFGMKARKPGTVLGSGNVFRDLRRPGPDLQQLKALLAALIVRALDESALSVRKAESMTGIAAADFSRIRNANLGRFTVDRLMTILGRLGQDVDVSVTAHRRRTKPDNTRPIAA